MQDAVPVGRGSMIAVIGLGIDEINNHIKSMNNQNEICEIANDNADGQVIISGDKNCINSLQHLLKEKKIKSIPLKVSATFHCSLMKPAAEKMKEKISKIKFNNPIFEIINNVTAKPEQNADKIKNLLIDQIFSTVKWRQSLINMSQKGVKTFIEIGPGKALTGMAKRTIKEANCF